MHPGPTYVLGGYHEVPPPPDLARYVERLWWYARPSGAPPIPGRGHRVLPFTGISLCFECVRGPGGLVRDGRLTLIGPLRGTRFFNPAPGVHLEAVRLKPEWAMVLLGVRPGDHADAVDPFASAAGRAIATPLKNGLPRTRSSAESVAVLLAWLRERDLSSRAPRDRARAEIARAALDPVRAARTTTIGIRGMAGELRVSERHLRRVVRELTGDSPKHHHRVGRLGRLVAAADAAGPAPNWARLAVACGFYDQSHMIQEVGDLVGLTPRATHRERSMQRIG